MKKNKRVRLNKVEKPQNEIIETEPKVEEVIGEEQEMTVEELIAQEEFIEELPVEEPQVEVGAPFDEPLKEFHHEFQKDYFFGTPSESSDKQTVIDTLPEPVVEIPKPRTLGSLNRDELRHFQRTGVMPK